MSTTTVSSYKNGTPWAECVEFDPWYEEMLPQKAMRPAKWSFDDVRPVLEELQTSDRSRGCSLVHKDITGTAGTVPGISLTFNVLAPHEHFRFHRHNYAVAYYYVNGQGYSILDEEGVDREESRIYWKEGDVVAVPPWALHAHVSERDEPVIQLAIHDLPDLAFKRNLLIEDPLGNELKHVVRDGGD
jgi:gentisate 1,2-dioxygenase